MNYILTILIALSGGYIFKKLKVPLGALLGSLFCVSIYQLLTNQAVLIDQTSFILQVCSGVLIGNKITLDILKSLKELWKPYLSMMVLLVIILCFMATLLVWLTHIDIMTAIFSLAPGGATDLTILSSQFNANMSYVALIHTCRKLLIMVLVPFVAKALCQKEESVQLEQQAASKDPKQLLLAISFATIIAFIFDALNIKAGAMIGSLVGATFYKICIHDFSCPLQFTFFLQVFAGALVGVIFNQDLLMQLSSLWIAVIIVIIETLIIIFANSIIMQKWFRMSKLTSILCSAPGAISDITILGEALGGDLPKIATLQILRMFSIVLIIPYLATLLSYWFK